MYYLAAVLLFVLAQSSSAATWVVPGLAGQANSSPAVSTEDSHVLRAGRDHGADPRRDLDTVRARFSPAPFICDDTSGIGANVDLNGFTGSFQASAMVRVELDDGDSQPQVGLAQLPPKGEFRRGWITYTSLVGQVLRLH